MSPRSSGGAAVARAAPVFAALGDPTRLALVARLSAGGPLSVSRLCEGADVTRQAVSKHLASLANAGLVRATRRGRERIFELAPGRLDEARAWLDRVSAEWDAALGRLKAYVED